MVPVTATPGADEFTPIFKFFNHHTRDRRRPTTHTHTKTKTKSIGYRKPDRIKVRRPHSMPEIQGQRPKDCVLAGKKTLEQSERVGRASP